MRVYFDQATGAVLYTYEGRPEGAPAGGFVEVPAGWDAGADFRAWRVDLDTLALVSVDIPPSPADIDAERDRRTEGSFYYLGHRFDCDAVARQNISGASALALGAMIQGAPPGVLDWTGSGEDFTWLSADNVPVPMDAYAMFAFGSAAAAHVRAHIFAARQLKDAPDPVLDFDAAWHWPEVAQ